MVSKNWSSFEGQQLLHENWRKFLSEESGTAKFFRDAGFTTDDHWDKDSEGAEAKLGYGLDSERNTESLLTFLRRGAPFLKTAQAQSLIAVMSQVAEDEGIMLELSLKGLNSEQDRIIDSAGTAEILATIASFGLKPQQQNRLLKTLNHWGRMNSIKFTAPPATPPPVTGDLPNADQEAEAEADASKKNSEEESDGGVGPSDPPEISMPDLEPLVPDSEDDEEIEPFEIEPFEAPDSERTPPDDLTRAKMRQLDLASFLADNPEYTPMDTYAKEWLETIVNQSPQVLRPFSMQLGALLGRGGGIDFDATRNPSAYFLDTFAWDEHNNDYLHPQEHLQVRDVGSTEKKNLFVLASRAAEAENQHNPTELPMDAPRLSLQETLFKKWQLIAGITKKVL